jgi:vacuolar protein sorting-associated protein 45
MTFLLCLITCGSSVKTTHNQKVDQVCAFADRSNTDTMKALTQKMIKNIQGVENIYTQHNCWLKEVLEELIRGKLKTTQFPYSGTAQLIDRPQRIVVFMIGGATYEESLAVYSLNKSYANQVQIILGATQVHNFSSYLQEITNATDVKI